MRRTALTIVAAGALCVAGIAFAAALGPATPPGPPPTVPDRSPPPPAWIEVAPQEAWLAYGTYYWNGENIGLYAYPNVPEMTLKPGDVVRFHLRFTPTARPFPPTLDIGPYSTRDPNAPSQIYRLEAGEVIAWTVPRTGPVARYRGWRKATLGAYTGAAAPQNFASYVAKIRIAGPATPPAARVTTLRVTLSDFRIVVRSTSGKRVSSIKAGQTRFVVRNAGKLRHDFKIGGKKTPVLARGKSATLNVSLGKGRKAYLCTVAGHAAAGMKGTLRVG